MRRFFTLNLLALTPFLATALYLSLTPEETATHHVAPAPLLEEAPILEAFYVPTPLPCQTDALATAHAWLTALTATDHDTLTRLETPGSTTPPPAPVQAFVIETWEPDGTEAFVFAHLIRSDRWGSTSEAIALRLVQRHGTWYVAT